MVAGRARASVFAFALMGVSACTSSVSPRVNRDAATEAAPDTGAARLDAATDERRDVAIEALSDVQVEARLDATLVAPTVVYSQTRPLAGLALAGDTLYVSVPPIVGSATINDGSIIAVPKAAESAMLGAGATTVIGNIGPRALMVRDNQLYWDNAIDLSNSAIFTAPVTGGAPSSVFGSQYGLAAITHFAVAGSTLYIVGSPASEIWSWPLGSNALPTRYLQYRGDQVAGLDSDGRSIFYFLPGLRGLDLCITAIGDLASVTLLSPNATSADFAAEMYTLTDETSVYWNTQLKIYSLPKAPTPNDKPKLLATMPGGLFVQLLLDGPNLYALSDAQLVRIPKAGGTPVVLAEPADPTLEGSATNALGMAVDDTFLYWVSQGQILKIPK
jgi:hypothetical protein